MRKQKNVLNRLLPATLLCVLAGLVCVGVLRHTLKPIPERGAWFVAEGTLELKEQAKGGVALKLDGEYPSTLYGCHTVQYSSRMTCQNTEGARIDLFAGKQVQIYWFNEKQWGWGRYVTRSVLEIHANGRPIYNYQNANAGARMLARGLPAVLAIGFLGVSFLILTFLLKKKA